MARNIQKYPLIPEEAAGLLTACGRLHSADPSKPFARQVLDVLPQALGGVRFSIMMYRLQPFRAIERKIHTPDYVHWFPRYKELLSGRPNQQRCMVIVDPARGMRWLDSEDSGAEAPSLFRSMQEQTGSSRQLWLGISDGNEHLTWVSAVQRAFTIEQLELICLIRPQLQNAWKNWKRTRSLIGELERYRRSAGPAGKMKGAAAPVLGALDALTPRQREIAGLVAHGCDNQQVADQLGISSLTVKKHLQAIFRSLNIQHRTMLVALWHNADSAKR